MAEWHLRRVCVCGFCLSLTLSYRAQYKPLRTLCQMSNPAENFFRSNLQHPNGLFTASQILTLEYNGFDRWGGTGSVGVLDMLCQSSSQPSRNEFLARSPSIFKPRSSALSRFQQLTNCPRISPPLASLCFQALTHCPICKPFVFRTLQQYRGVVGGLERNRIIPSLCGGERRIGGEEGNLNAQRL